MGLLSSINLLTEKPFSGEARMGRSRVAVWFLSLCLVLTGTVVAQTAPAVGGSAAAHSTRTIQLVGVRAVLDKSLDARKAKQGDAVVAKPEVKIHVADGLDLETSSLLLGRVDAVHPSTDKSDSAIAVTFDKVRLKGGREVPVKATILWIGQPPNLLNPTIISAPADRTTPGVGVGAGMTGVPPEQGYQGSEIAGAPRRHRNRPAAAPPVCGHRSRLRPRSMLVGRWTSCITSSPAVVASVFST